MNREFAKTYKGKKVFITGHTGFKGSWLSVWLTIIGARVKGYSLAPDADQLLFKSIRKKIDCESVISDIRDRDKLKSEVRKFKPDFIFHLAAQSLVRRSYLWPLDTFETNIIGTANLLNSLKEISNECYVVVITTDKVYENKEWSYPYRENDELGGYDPYSASKAGAEIITSSMRNSFFKADDFKKHLKAISTARAGNVIGGGDYSMDRIIPDIIRSIESNRPVKVRNPESVRPWQHVLDPLSGYLLLGSRMSGNSGKYSGAYNFGPALESNLKVKELVDKVILYYGKGKYKISKMKNEPHEAGLLRLDISKATTELGWKPKWDSDTAVEKTIGWYKNSYGKPEINFELCLRDIESFSQTI